MTQVQIWSEFFILNDEKSEVNIIQLEDKSFWFQFSHLAKLLGYSNPTVAIQTHCEDYEIQKLDIGKHELVNFVSESGFYSLVMGSNKPIAKKFKRWVCSEILPKLRTSGGYIMPNVTSQQIQALRSELDEKDAIIKQLADTHTVKNIVREFVSKNFVYYPGKKAVADKKDPGTNYVTSFDVFKRWEKWLPLAYPWLDSSIVITFPVLMLNIDEYLKSLPENPYNRIAIHVNNGLGDLENCKMLPLTKVVNLGIAAPNTIGQNF